MRMKRCHHNYIALADVSRHKLHPVRKRGCEPCSVPLIQIYMLQLGLAMSLCGVGGRVSFDFSLCTAATHAHLFLGFFTVPDFLYF